MVEPIRLDKKALREQFGVSERLAIRVGALLARKFGVTAAVIEMASPRSAGEALLLSPALLDRAASLTKKDLSAVLKKTKGAGDLPPLSIHSHEGLRTLCLAEEIEAERGFSHASGGELALASSRALLRPEEAKRLFTPEEIARLKFVLLTSADPKAKIEAIRSVLVSPLPPQEQGVLCLMALADASPEVRKETAAALRHLGLDPDLTDSIRGLAEPDPLRRRAAYGAIRKIAPKAGPGERGVLLRVLLGGLENEKDPALAAAGVDALTEMSAALAASPDSLPDVLRLVVSLLAAHFDALSSSARGLCRKLGKHAASPLAVVLWTQVEHAEDRRVRAYLMLLLADLAPAEEQARLATEVVKTIASWSDTEADCRRLAAALEPLGRHGIEAILEGWPAVREEQQPFVLRTLDGLLSRATVSKEIGSRLGQFLLSLLPAARRSLRLALMETRLLGNPALSVDTRRKLAEELLRSAHDYRLDRVYDLTETVLHRLGLCSVEPLMRAVDESPYEAVRLLALKILSRQVASMGDPSLAGEVGRVCRWAERLFQEFPAQGEAARALGTFTQSPHAPADFVERVAAELRTRLGKSANTLDYVQALAALAGSPVVPLKLRMELAMLFLELLDTEMPTDFAQETRTAEGTLLEVKKPAQLYTDYLPAVVEGLERIAVARGTTGMLQERVTQRLLARWAEVSEYKVIWGPNAVTRLAEALGAIGAAAETPLHLKLAVLAALRSRLSNVTIAAIVGRILAGPEDDEPFVRACEAVVEEMCRMAVHRDYQEREDRQVLLGVLGRLARRKRIATQAKRTEALRRRIVDLLVDSLRDRMPGSRDALALLAEDEAVPKAQRTQVQERLKRL